MPISSAIRNSEFRQRRHTEELQAILCNTRITGESRYPGIFVDRLDADYVFGVIQ